jgi:hypothetical protein
MNAMCEAPTTPSDATERLAGPQPAADAVDQRIFVVRGRRVMLDADLAALYGVRLKRLNEQVRRNRERFPDDFMLQLSFEEVRELRGSRSQIATMKQGQNVKYAPYAFTEHGAVMLASVLNSPAAIDASIQVVRAFVRLRAMVAVHEELARKLAGLERKYDKQFRVVFEAIRALMTPEPKRLRGRIGFRGGDDPTQAGDEHDDLRDDV